MPWVLLAAVLGAGGLYYEVNKGRATNTRWELHFPASSALILSGLMDAVTPLGGTVLDKGAGVYVVSVPAKVDLSHALPPNLVPPNIVISGASLDSYLQSDDRMPEVGDKTGQKPRIPPGRHECIIGGMRWDGQNLRDLSRTKGAG